MVEHVKKHWVDFWSIFKDDNDYNEKNIVGFISFILMVIIAITEIVLGFLGHKLEVSEFIYDSFFWITIGSFGIGEIGKVFKDREDIQRNRDKYSEWY